MTSAECYHKSTLSSDACQGEVKPCQGIDIIGRSRMDLLCERHAAQMRTRVAHFDESLRHRAEIAESLAGRPDYHSGGRHCMAAWAEHSPECPCQCCAWANANLDTWVDR